MNRTHSSALGPRHYPLAATEADIHTRIEVENDLREYAVASVKDFALPAGFLDTIVAKATFDLTPGKKAPSARRSLADRHREVASAALAYVQSLGDNPINFNAATFEKIAAHHLAKRRGEEGLAAKEHSGLWRDGTHSSSRFDGMTGKAGEAEIAALASNLGLDWTTEYPAFLGLGPEAMRLLAELHFRHDSYRDLTEKANYSARDVVALAEYARQNGVDANALAKTQPPRDSLLAAAFAENIGPALSTRRKKRSGEDGSDDEGSGGKGKGGKGSGGDGKDEGGDVLGAARYKRLNGWDSGMFALFDDDEETASRKSGARNTRKRFGIPMRLVPGIEARRQAVQTVERAATEAARQIAPDPFFMRGEAPLFADRLRRDKRLFDPHVTALANGQVPVALQSRMEAEIKKLRANQEYSTLMANPAMLRGLMQNAPNAMLAEMAKRLGLTSAEGMQDFVAHERRNMNFVAGASHDGLPRNHALSAALNSSARDMHGLMNPALNAKDAQALFKKSPVTKPFADAGMSLAETKLLYSKLHMKGLDDGAIARLAQAAHAVTQSRELDVRRAAEISRTQAQRSALDAHASANANANAQRAMLDNRKAGENDFHKAVQAAINKGANGANQNTLPPAQLTRDQRSTPLANYVVSNAERLQRTFEERREGQPQISQVRTNPLGGKTAPDSESPPVTRHADNNRQPTNPFVGKSGAGGGEPPPVTRHADNNRQPTNPFVGKSGAGGGEPPPVTRHADNNRQPTNPFVGKSGAGGGEPPPVTRHADNNRQPTNPFVGKSGAGGGEPPPVTRHADNNRQPTNPFVGKSGAGGGEPPPVTRHADNGRQPTNPFVGKSGAGGGEPPPVIRHADNNRQPTNPFVGKSGAGVDTTVRQANNEKPETNPFRSKPRSDGQPPSSQQANNGNPPTNPFSNKSAPAGDEPGKRQANDEKSPPTVRNQQMASLPKPKPNKTGRKPSEPTLA